MSLFVALMSEFLAAVLTFEGPCLGVRAHVVHQVALLIEMLLAGQTDQSLVVPACFFVLYKFPLELLLFPSYFL